MSIPRITEILEEVTGCFITRLIQVSDHSIAITIVDPAAVQTDVITIDGLDITFVSDALPTKKKVSDGLIAAIASSAAAGKFVVSQGAAANYSIILKPAGVVDPVVSVSANLADTPTDGYARVNGLFGAKLVALALDAPTAGTITLADAGTVKQIIPADGIAYGEPVNFYGAKFTSRLEIKLSEAADTGAVFWRNL